MKAKILIVGGGVLGNSIALATARRLDPLEEPVVLLERTVLASGSSGRSGGLVRQQYADPMIAAMARDSIREYTSFETRTGRSVGFQRAGVLTLAGPSRPESLEKLTTNVELQRSIGIDAQVLDAAAIRERVPGIVVDDRAIAAWEPGGGFVDPNRTVAEFAALARSYGAATRLGVEVTDLQIEGGRLVGARTTEGDYQVEQLVLVAGAWSRRFLARFGIALPIEVARIQQLFVSLPGEKLEADPRLSETSGWSNVDLEDPLEREQERLLGKEEPLAVVAHPVIIDLEYGFYTRCEPEYRRTRVSPIAQSRDLLRPEPDENDGPKPELARQLFALLAKRLPVYEAEQQLESLVSWFPTTRDGRAIVGEMPGVRGLFVATGFADHGFKLAPAVGQGVSQMLLGEPVSAFDPAYFAPDRFGSGVQDAGWNGDIYL
ncbi:MAG TPA: FAD-binding oxidoreductase [Planctomycetota bacterium]|nr:FAD-binding oxidoreductase [Planctomycetota bacterium]